MRGNKISFGIVGAGAWGIAFARLVAGNGCKTLIWDRNPSVITSINEHHISPCFADVNLPKQIVGVENIKDLEESEIIVLALPFQVLSGFLENPQMAVLHNKQFLMLSKGIEIATRRLGHQIVAECLPSAKFAVMSGPNFASEIVRGLPAATMVAGSDAQVLSSIQRAIMCDNMRVYTTDDVIGVETCGAIKNVIAIAAGITVGARYGENAKAALISRSLEEIKLLLKSIGGMAETAYSLAGIGDLMLTCGSTTSRNFAFGFEIGENGSINKLLENNTKTIEGIHTSKAIYELSQDKGLDMPICKEVYNIIFRDKPVLEALQSLMQRNTKYS